MDEKTKKLYELAKSVKSNAYCPISNYQVGASVETEDGNLYAGCNVESVTFNISTHAEMNAIDSAVAAGSKKIKRILVVTDSNNPIFPCALCRQKIIDFGGDAEVIAATMSGNIQKMNIKELYPKAFTLSNIEQ